jgi:hypothetical protein
MPPLLELQVQFGAIEPGDGLRQSMPGNLSKDRVMRPAGVSYFHIAGCDVHVGLSPDKMAKDLLSVALIEAPELLGQHAVEGVGDHGHQDVEVHLHQNRRRQGVEVEKLNRLGDDILHSPPAGVVADDTFRRGLKIVGDQEGRILAAVPPEDDLPELPFIIFEVDKGLMDVWIGVFPFFVGDVDPLPGFEFLQIPDQVLAPPPERDKPDTLTVQQGQMFIGGKLGIEDKGGGDAFVNLLPERQNIENLFIGLLLHEVGGRIKHKLGGGILGKEGQCPFHSLSPGPGPMLLKDGFIPVVGDGVEVQIDDAPVVQPQFQCPFDKGLLKLQDVNLVEGIGIGGHGRALGEDIQPGEQAQAGIEGMVSHVTVPLRADEFQGQKREKIADRRNDLAPWQTCGTDHLRHLKLLQKRNKQKGPRGFAGKMLSLHLCNGNALRSLRNLRPLDGQTDLQAGATGKFGESLFRQNPLHRSDRDVHPLFGKQLGDLSCREFFLPPGTDFPAGLCGYPVTRGASFRNRFGKVEFAGGELMSKQANISGGVSEAFRHGFRWQTVHEGGPEGFVPFLPFMDRFCEVGGVAHGNVI